MTYEIEFSSAADREFRRLDRQVAQRIESAINRLRSNPRPHGCKKLTGANHWRIRVGDWRIVYEICDGRLIVLIVRIAHRSNVYD